MYLVIRMEWKLVKVYECPKCGEWVKDMDDARDHECLWKKVSKEIDEDLKLLSEIEKLKTELESIPFYEFSKRGDIKFKIFELEGKRMYGYLRSNSLIPAKE